MNELLKQAYAAATSTNYLYNRHQSRWTFLLNSYAGGNEYKKGNYLHRYELENDKDYQRRLAQTPLDNQVRGVISLYNSFLFRQIPERDFGNIEQDPRIIDILEDADLDGRNINQFMRDVAVWSQVFGMCWVGISKPNTQANTLADELAQNVRPYFNILSPLSVTDWAWDRLPNGAYELSMIKYLEEIDDTITVVKYWTRDTITTTVINNKDRKAESVLDEPNELGKIPFVLVYAERSPVRGIGLSVVEDIADQQMMSYNESSEIWESIRLDTHPSLVATADTDIGTGAGSLIRMPDNLPADMKPYLLQFTGAPVASIYQSINERKKMIDAMANVGSARGTESTSMSGVALEVEWQLLNARLSLLADGLELAEEQIWQWVCLYLGVEWTGCVKYPDSFSVRDTGRELQQLITAHGVVDSVAAKAAIEQSILDLLEIEVGSSPEELVNGCPIPMTDKSINIANHLIAVEQANLGPASVTRPGVFWMQRADRLGITPAESMNQTCSNCGYYTNTQSIKNCFDSNMAAGNIPLATEVNTAWENVAGAAGYCVKYDITCTPTRTCDSWITGGPIV